MYRVTVVSGPKDVEPSRGVSFTLQEHGLRMGRTDDNDIVLRSTKVSKHHCHLRLIKGRLEIKDEGSSNGTFVNGRLVSSRPVRTGDRIGVGEYLFEVREVVQSIGAMTIPSPLVRDVSSSSEPEEQIRSPEDLAGKIAFQMEKSILPFFYEMNERYEWKSMFIGICALFCLLTAGLSTWPVMDQSKKRLSQEISKRSSALAKRLADENAPALAARQESKLDVSALARADQVRVAVLVDMEQKILAPAALVNQYLTAKPEGPYVANILREFAKGRDKGISMTFPEEIALSVEPIRIFNPTSGQNQLAAFAVVSLSTASTSDAEADQMLALAYSMVISAVVGLILFFILYRVTLKPFSIMNSKIDSVLRGEMVEFSPRNKFEEIQPLWEIVDSALKRIPRSEISASANSFADDTNNPASQLSATLRGLATSLKDASLVLDHDLKILYLNNPAEEVVGFRNDSSYLNPLSSVARDQAFSQLIQDHKARVSMEQPEASDDFDFSGISFRVTTCVFYLRNKVAFYFVSMTKVENG